MATTARHGAPAHAPPAQTQSASTQAAPTQAAGGTQMSHRQIMEALSGLLLGMFVAILSSTIVSTALPRIIADLNGSQSAYTWVVTATLLTMTATTPLWGKLADLTSKKVLVQTAIVIFVLASAGAGFSQNAGTLIAFRAIQGVGMGGLTALAQIILAAMIAPRERGRYNGYLGATFAVATVGGPLLGGVITDTSWLGWRWCFYVGVPFAILALLVLQKTLHLPVVKREGVKIDWLGSLFFAASVCLLLVWVTLAGDSYDWLSWQTYAMVGGSLLLGAIFLLIENKAREPIVPLRLFRNRTITLASLASLFVGIAMFGATVFLAQYFQLARGASPTKAGLMTIPMIAGLFLSSTVSGQVITRTGRWKVWLCSGAVLLTGGLGLLGTMRYDTPYVQVACFMALLGLGVGMMMQNLVLCTQNQVDPRDLGSASAVVTFFRSLGGAIGVSMLGAVLAERITQYVKEGMAELGVPTGGGSPTGGSVPDLSTLPGPIRTVVKSAYGHGIADIYLYATPVALLSLLLVLFIKEVPLKTKSAMQAASDQSEPAPRSDAPAAAGFAGLVRSAVDGGPVADATVVVTDVRGEVLATGKTGGEGEFRFDGLQTRTDSADGTKPGGGGGQCTVAVNAPGFRPTAQLVETGEGGQGATRVQVELRPSVRLRGTVRTGGARRPLGEARVTLVDAAGNVVATSVTDEDGTYAFTDLDSGEYTLLAGDHPPAANALTVDGHGVDGYDVELTHPDA